MTRKLIVTMFFLFLPLVGIFLHLFTEILPLSPWGIIIVVISMIFSVFFIMNHFFVSKALGILLVVLIVSENIFSILNSSDEITPVVIHIVIEIVYQTILGVLILYILHRPKDLSPRIRK